MFGAPGERYCLWLLILPEHLPWPALHQTRPGVSQLLVDKISMEKGISVLKKSQTL